jgi:hypothetical protein
MSLRLHSKHGVAPALTFCRICGKEANEIALLGSQCDTVLKQVYEATDGAHGDKDGYKDYGFNRIPSTEPCDECQKHLKSGGRSEDFFIRNSVGIQDNSAISYLKSIDKMENY